MTIVVCSRPGWPQYTGVGVYMIASIYIAILDVSSYLTSLDIISFPGITHQYGSLAKHGDYKSNQTVQQLYVIISSF